MESLLSLSFDYLSSLDGIKIRKGLRQLEGLVAQICLSKAHSNSNPSAADRRRSVVALNSTTPEQSPKELSALKEDPAFREFFKLQEGFEWNIATRLVACLERLLGKGSNGQNDLLLVSTLDLLHGILLMHPPSRSLFAREIYMNLLLDLLDPSSCPAIQSSTLLTLVTALLDHPCNTRTFESLDGLLTVTSLFKSRGTSREVKMKLVEFLYFYLMPEMPYSNVGNRVGSGLLQGGGMLQRNPSKRLGAVASGGRGSSGAAAAVVGARREVEMMKTTEEKQALLGRYLPNVEDLVEDLRESAPFGASLA